MAIDNVREVVESQPWREVNRARWQCHHIGHLKRCLGQDWIHKGQTRNWDIMWPLTCEPTQRGRKGEREQYHMQLLSLYGWIHMEMGRGAMHYVAWLGRVGTWQCILSLDWVELGEDNAFCLLIKHDIDDTENASFPSMIVHFHTWSSIKEVRLWSLMKMLVRDRSPPGSD